MKSEQAQRRIIAAALFCVESTAELPSAYEQALAEKYIQGTLSIYESMALLEAYNHQQAGFAHYYPPAS